jgi:hypothetical protein
MPGAGVPEGVGRLWARVYISFMHLYIHVPFCGRRCSYCDFAIAVRKAVPSQAYLDAVLGEWTLWQEEEVWDESPGIETIYLGGGTPSRIAPEVIGRLLNRIAAARAVVSGAEITLEANPDDVTSASVSGWKAAGVNRISLGVQSFDPAVLRWMHRLHSVDQVYRSVAAIRDAGFTNLSLDLIFGLPEAQRRDWANDLEEALALEPEHLSLYGLTVEPHTPLGRWTDRGEVKPVGEGRYAAEFLLADEVLRGRAYEHYEVSNFCRPGHPQRAGPGTPLECPGMGRLSENRGRGAVAPGWKGASGRGGGRPGASLSRAPDREWGTGGSHTGGSGPPMVHGRVGASGTRSGAAHSRRVAPAGCVSRGRAGLRPSAARRSFAPLHLASKFPQCQQRIS